MVRRAQAQAGNALSNLSILQRNIIHALDCEVVGKAFLRACDKVGVKAAERFAFEHRDLLRSIAPALAAASCGHGLEAIPDGLVKFIMDRHWHMRMN